MLASLLEPPSPQFLKVSISLAALLEKIFQTQKENPRVFGQVKNSYNLRTALKILPKRSHLPAKSCSAAAPTMRNVTHDLIIRQGKSLNINCIKVSTDYLCDTQGKRVFKCLLFYTKGRTSSSFQFSTQVNNTLVKRGYLEQQEGGSWHSLGFPVQEGRCRLLF
jgi:hypothetical protein